MKEWKYFLMGMHWFSKARICRFCGKTFGKVANGFLKHGESPKAIAALNLQEQSLEIANEFYDNAIKNMTIFRDLRIK